MFSSHAKRTLLSVLLSARNLEVVLVVFLIIVLVVLLVIVLIVLLVIVLILAAVCAVACFVVIVAVLVKIILRHLRYLLKIVVCFHKAGFLLLSRFLLLNDHTNSISTICEKYTKIF